MPLPRLPFTTLTSTKQLISGNIINGINNLLTGTATGVTATPGGNATNSTKLNAAFNEILNVATNNDGVVLPPAKSGLSICITDASTQSVRVWANGTDLIINSTSLIITSNTSIMFICTKDGIWKVLALN